MFTPLATSTMLSIVSTMGKFDPFFLRLFFGSVVTSPDESIHFDKIHDDVVMAPFVSPMIAGKVHKEKGGDLHTTQGASVVGLLASQRCLVHLGKVQK